MNIVVLDLLAKYLGPGEKKKDANYAFHCPFCNHQKKKLEVDTGISGEMRGNWNCWVCHTRGKSIYSLLVRLKASPADLNLLGRHKSIHPAVTLFTGSNEAVHEVLDLPANYKQLTGSETDHEVRQVLNKLYARHLTSEDLLKYKIGYITAGTRRNNVVLPSYDSEGKLNYYVLKDFKTGEYINPPVSRDKVILDFFINWNNDVILVEGLFDAFAVQRNVTPLLGKTLSKSLKAKIVSSPAKNFYIGLDGGEHRAIAEIAEYITHAGKRAYKINLPPGEDPSSLGKDKIWEYIESAVLIEEDTIFLQNLLSRW